MKRKLLSILLTLCLAFSLLPTAALADGEETSQAEGGEQKTYVAQIGEEKYETLADAIAAAEDGNTVKLLADVIQNTMLTIDKNITLDLNGKKIYNTEDIWNETKQTYELINVEAEITITGNGSIEAKENDCYTINVKNGNLTIENGRFVGNVSVVQVESGTLTINGGEFKLLQKWEGSSKYLINCIDKNYENKSAVVDIRGGKFVDFDPNVAPEKKVDGKAPSFVISAGIGVTKDTDGNFTAAPGMAAQIVDAGGNSVKAYEGHKDAIDAAKDGETVILLSNRNNFVTNEINHNITIDLNGKTLSVGNNVSEMFKANGEVTIQNGTITSDMACAIVNAYNKLTLKNVRITGVTGGSGKNLVNVCSGAEVTIDKDTVLTASGSGVAVFIGQDADAKYTLNVYGKVIQNSKTYAICGNGSYKGTSTINIYDGAEVKSPICVAIYQPQAGVTNIYGGLVEGKCAIGIKSGALNISGGTVRGTVNDHVLSDKNSSGNGISYDGSAIIVDSRATGYAGNVKINITGGTVESYYSTAIREIGNDSSKTQLTELTVTGGNVFGASQKTENVENDMKVRDISVSNVSVSGGTFNHEVQSGYCADKFVPVNNNDGTYGVKVDDTAYVAKLLNAQGAFVDAYNTLADAVTAVPENGTEMTIKLLRNADGNGVDVKGGQKIVFDFDGHTYTLNGRMVGSPGTETNGFRFLKGSIVTLKNGTLANGKGENAAPAKAMINSYATLNLEDFSIDATTDVTTNSLYPFGCSALYISNGTTTITGNGSYTTNTDTNKWYYGIWMANVSGYSDSAKLVFDENYTGTMTGNIHTGNEQAAAIEIKSGNYIFGAITVANTNTTIAISGGNFSASVKDYIVGTLNAELKKASGDTPYSYYTSVAAATAAAKPGDTVTDLKAPAEQKVTLTLKYNDGATADITYNVASGTTITLPAPAHRSGYTFNGWYDGSTKVSSSYKVMKNVTLTASWSYNYSGGSSSYDPTYSVSTPSKTEHGSVTVSPKNASKGDTVTVTVKPNSGYVLETLTVTDKNGNELTLKDKGNGKYTFTMPAGKVEVKATFMEDNSMLNFFYDVPNNAYFYEAVKWAVKNGITTGVGNDLFAPEQPCTRAQIVTFLWRAAGSPEPKGASSFADVAAGSYYAKAVAWAVENGITTGTGDGKFSPDATCTRAQAVTFLARALSAKASGKAEFSDVPADSYFADAVAWAAANGVTEGIGGGLFGSDNDCTRGQIVTFLYRAYNK